MKTILRRLLIITAILVPSAACLFLLIPFILDWYIIPNLLDKISPLKKSAVISRLTPFSTQASLRLEHQGQPVISIPFMQLSYSPGFVFSRNLSTLQINNATIHISRKNGRLFMAGFDETKAGKSKPFSLPVLPLTLNSLDLNECSIVIHETGKTDLRFTLSAKLHLLFGEDSQKRKHPASITGSLLLFDTIPGQAEIACTFGEEKHTVRISIETGVLPISEFLPPIPNLDLNVSKLKANLTSSIDVKTFTMLDFETTGSLEGFHGSFNNIGLAGKGKNTVVPFSLSTSFGTYEYAIGPADIQRPFSGEARLNGNGTISEKSIATTGVLAARISESSALSEPFLVPLHYTGSFDAGEKWDTTFSLVSTKHRVTLKNQFSAEIPAFTFDGELHRTQSGIDGSAALITEPFSITPKETRLNLAEITLEAGLFHTAENTDALVSIKTPYIEAPTDKVKFEDIRLLLPVSYPFQAKTIEQNGILSVKKIRLKNSSLASFAATISQQDQLLKILGSLKSDYLPESVITVDATVNPLQKEASVSYDMGKTVITSSQLPPFLKIPEKVVFAGSIDTHGSLLYRNDRFTGTMEATLSDGSFEITEKKYSINSIDCNIELPRLPEIASRPNQYCTIDSIDFGNMHFSDVGIHFRFDDPETIFVEKIRAAWCRGLVESTSLKFSTDDKELETTLYCSKINFADLLNQFGLDQAQGEGTVNGKLPIQFSKKRLQFDDGFLFSTPGTGGIVKFSNTDMLRQGIGAVNTGGYLDYSMQAMEDFSYNWTKLSFISEDEDLLLTMELDGKPRKPLPYKFNNGMLVKTTQQEGLQYPLRLDVNFRLPLADILEVGQNIQSIKENM